MAKADKEKIEVEGVVKETLPNANFLVVVVGQKHSIHAHVSGKIRMHYIRILPGDRASSRRTAWTSRPRRSTTSSTPTW